MFTWNLFLKNVFFSQPKKKKNIEHDIFTTKTARIHMQKQDLDSLQTRKMKGLKRRKEHTEVTGDDAAKRQKETEN